MQTKKRIQPVHPAEASGTARPLLDAAQAQPSLPPDQKRLDRLSTPMTRISTILASLALTTTLTLAKDLVNADAASHTGLQGYDPVAFFADSQATKGNPIITGEHKGVTYLFANEEHKAAFAENPEKYLPAYGGYCAYGASINKLFPVEIDTWEIIEGRLVLQYNQDIKRKFAQDKAANLRKADANWPKLVEAKGR